MKQAKENAQTGANGQNEAESLTAAKEVSEKTSKESGGDAISLLKQDHREVEQLFERYESAKRRADRAKIVAQVCNALTLHAILEEEVFYPACRELIDDDPLDEAQVEHDSAKILINELISAAPGDPFFDAKVKVLAEQIKQHIKEEEGQPDSIFAQVEAAGADLAAIGEKLKARKAELSDRIERGTLHVGLRSFTKAASLAEESDDESSASDQRERGSRYRGDEEAGRRRDEQGRFMSDTDYGEGHGRGYRDPNYRSSSRGRSSFEDERYSSRGQRTPERDEHGRFVSDDEGRDRACSRGGDDERRSARSGRHSGWFGDPDGHAEASRRRWDEREGERRSDRDEEAHRGSSHGGDRRFEHRSREDELDERHGHSGWYGDREGHAEASRRGWEHRR
jgi:hemerythrin superfamily protein